MTQHKEHEFDEHEHEGKDPFSAEKIFGVATIGAIGTLGLYFIYQSLGEDTKKRVKERVTHGFKAAIGQGALCE